jgi:hypothetical protein
MGIFENYCSATLLSKDQPERGALENEKSLTPCPPISELPESGDLTRADLAGWAQAEARRTLARIAGTRDPLPDEEAARLKHTGVTSAELKAARQDLWAVLSLAPQEAPAIEKALLEGRVDGGTYYGECACLIGTIANARGCDVYSLGALRPAPDRPIEHLFMRISRGDTPQNNPVAKLIVQWIQNWCVTLG